ncbi:MAG: ABC transporter ATP-binding protein [Eubacteriales bacterium]|nr:ABC transporter ATP-binding protein [Eubacteriales bacterium]
MEQLRHKKKAGNLLRLLQYLFSHYGKRLTLVAVCIVISASASVVQTVFLQRLIDECITPGLTAGLPAVWDSLVSIILTMIVLYLCGVTASFTYTRIMAGVTQGTLRNLRNDMFDRMETLPIRYFDTHAHGDIMSTYTNDTDAIRQLIGQSLPMITQSFLTVTVMFFMMLYFSIWLTLVVCCFAALMLLVSRKFAGASSKYMMAQQKSLAAEEGFIEEMMEGQKVIKVFCHEEESKKDFCRFNEELFSVGEKAHRYGNSLMPILNNMGNVMYVVLAVTGGLLVYFGAPNLSLTGWDLVSIGIIISFLNMARQLSQTIGQASMQVSLIAMGLAGAGRVFDLIDQVPEEDHGYVTLVNAKRNADGTLSETDHPTGLWAWKHPHQADGTVTYTELKGDIKLEHVDFGYNPDKLVLHDISLYAKPGQKIAFVGSTGAGKTTITNLINRFYDIPDGKIRYDGININKIRKPDLRRSLGVVLQDVNLFTGTVLDNIRYGRLDATDEECIAAAKLANADDFITRLPDGYNTMLTGNGASLSQGQRQLISIARAAVADPPVMILDEATSSIDTRTEALVQAGMDNLMEGRTVFVIAHRLSTVRNSKAIMVLDHGRIIERGDHDSLIAEKGTYYQLYTGAFELE